MKALSFQEGESEDCIDITLPDGSIIPGLERSTFSIHGPAKILPRDYAGESPFATEPVPIEVEPDTDDPEYSEYDELDFPREEVPEEDDNDNYFQWDGPCVSG
jgi:hypothetical protein